MDAKKVVRIERPIVMVYEDGGAILFRIHRTEKTYSHKHFGMLVCDLVRHVAKALESFRAVPASASIAQAFGVMEGAPLSMSDRVVYLRDGRPAEWRITYSLRD
jgi:DNA-binding GntR family transcriptional regulator